jgi:hypothetical protein
MHTHYYQVISCVWKTACNVSKAQGTIGIIPDFTDVGTWRNWLRHCVASPKVAGSISDGVTGVFH